MIKGKEGDINNRHTLKPIETNMPQGANVFCIITSFFPEALISRDDEEESISFGL